MQALHMLWIPFAYIFAPKKLTQMSLRGHLLDLGITSNALPASAVNEIAERVYMLHKRIVTEHGLLGRIKSLSESVSVNAQQIAATMHERDRRNKFLAGCHFHREVLERHGVKTDPILVDKNGVWI